MFAEFNLDFIEALRERSADIAASDAHARVRALMTELDAPLLRDVVFPHPLVMSEADFNAISDASQAVLSAQLRIARAMCDTHTHAEILALLGAPTDMEPLVDWDNFRTGAVTIGRVDLIPTRDGYSICELNVHTAVGGSELHPCYELFFDAMNLPRVPDRWSPHRDLAALYAALCAESGADRIAILDSVAHGALGYPRQELLAAHLREQSPGVDVRLCDERTYPAAWLEPDVASRTLVHRMFTYDEITDDCQFLTRLCDAGARLTNGFEAELRMNKRWLSFLWDERYQHLLTERERAAVRAFVPRTVDITEQTLPELLAEHALWVFKPRDEYGGAGVIIGREHAAADIAARIRAAGLQHWIGQRFVEAQTVPLRGHPGLATGDYRIVLGLYVYNDVTNGMIVRGSAESSVVNVSNGAGGAGWAIVVDEAGKRRLLQSIADPQRSR